MRLRSRPLFPPLTALPVRIRPNPPPPCLGFRQAGGGFDPVSTVMLANHWSAVREIVAERILPEKRNVSRIRTNPRLGMRMRQASMANWSLVRVKLSRLLPFFLNCGYLARPAKKFLKAAPSWIIAICGAFLVTSSIHGNCSRLMAFNWRRKLIWLGFGWLLSFFPRRVLGLPFCQCPVVSKPRCTCGFRQVRRLLIVRVEADFVADDHEK